MTALGPVSASLEAELREVARQHGIVVWLDKEGAYTRFADGLAERASGGAFPVPVRRFRGSYLELMLDLEHLEDGVTMTPLIVHVPGHTEDTIAQTPLFELYSAGRRHRRALPTLVREVALGRASAEELDAFLAADGLTVEDADAWLVARDSAAQGMGGAGDGPDLSALSPEALVEALLPKLGTLADRAADPAVARAVRQRAAATLGVTESWYARWPGMGAGSSTQQAEELAFAIASWALCVEFVHDLRRTPYDAVLEALADLPKPAVAACHKLAAHLRERHGDLYVQIADETEQTLTAEATRATAVDLGKIDTFRFEDRVVLVAALDAMAAGTYQLAADYARERTRDHSFWPARDRGRQIAWQLVKLGARLGCAVTTHEGLLDGAGTLADAVERYAARGHEVDAAHRQLEQARHQLAHLELEEAGALRARLDELRGVYRRWADATAAYWSRLCKREGFLPAPELQQRTLFDEVVAPAAREGLTAYFLVDALRFEMGKQLADSLETRTADVAIGARLAELPTVTEVGMNVLAPVVRDGKLGIELDGDRILGFRAATARVDGPASRQQAIRDRIGGATCPKLALEELLERDPSSLRKSIARASLVIVHCEGIDKAGEKGVGLSVFERELQNLRAAWRLLYEAGVQRFVFAADHGFLLHDGITRDPILHGNRTAPRRHVIMARRRDQTGEVTVGSHELGYEGEPFFVAFPETVAPFDRGHRAKDFVHGGNSLQERVIPVITVRQRHAAGGAVAVYQVEVTAVQSTSKMQIVEAKIVPAGQASLSYGGSAEVELVLESAAGTDVEVELIYADGAKLTTGAVVAPIGQSFKVFFQLAGNAEERVPVRIRHATRSATVLPKVTEQRFQVVLRERAVTTAPSAAPATPAERTEGSPRTARTTAPPVTDTDWLAALPEGVRDVFRHLADHGSISEAEVMQLLGGARQLRNFSLRLDTYRERAPFAVHVDMTSGVKCYVRGDRDADAS